MSWGSEARKHREAAGLTRSQLAAKTGVHKNTIENFELDKLVSGVSLRVAVTLADYFKLSLDEYIGRVPPTPIKKLPEVRKTIWK